ncbi:hypothetical protein C8R45DRAFT_1070028 [Mycena sanguinolenta]|nr:hypothetical protein C8R45DRAFT_1070028 [Mycena sanguinolenta]
MAGSKQEILRGVQHASRKSYNHHTVESTRHFNQCNLWLGRVILFTLSTEINRSKDTRTQKFRPDTTHHRKRLSRDTPITGSTRVCAISKNHFFWFDWRGCRTECKGTHATATRTVRIHTDRYSTRLGSAQCASSMIYFSSSSLKNQGSESTSAERIDDGEELRVRAKSSTFGSGSRLSIWEISKHFRRESMNRHGKLEGATHHQTANLVHSSCQGYTCPQTHSDKDDIKVWRPGHIVITSSLDPLTLRDIARGNAPGRVALYRLC